MLIPEDGCLPKINRSGFTPFNNVMIIKVPEEFRKPGETIYQLATLDPSKKSEKWPADKYLDYLNSDKEKSFLKSNENEGDTNKINKSEVLAIDKKKSLFRPNKEKLKKIKKSNLPDQRKINHDTRINHNARINQDTRINHNKRVHRDTSFYNDSRSPHNKMHIDNLDPWLPGVAPLQTTITSSLLPSYDQSKLNTYKPSTNCSKSTKGLLGHKPVQKDLYSGPNVRSFDHIPASENIETTRIPESMYSGSHRDDLPRKGPLLNGPQNVNFDGPSRNGPPTNNFNGPFRNAPPKNKFRNSYQNNPPETAFGGIHRLSAAESTLTGTNRNVSKETGFGGMHRRDGLISDAYPPDSSYNIGYLEGPRNIPHNFDSYTNHYRDNFSSEPEYSSDRNYSRLNRDDSFKSNFNRSYANNPTNNLPSNSYDANFNDVLGHNPTTNICYENNYPQYGQEGMWDSQCEPNLGLNEPFRMPENVFQRNSFADGNQSRSWRGNKRGNSYYNAHRNRVRRGRGNNRFQKRT